MSILENANNYCDRREIWDALILDQNCLETVKILPRILNRNVYKFVKQNAKWFRDLKKAEEESKGRNFEMRDVLSERDTNKKDIV